MKKNHSELKNMVSETKKKKKIQQKSTMGYMKQRTELAIWKMRQQKHPTRMAKRKEN